jgi:hypothetical protein
MASINASTAGGGGVITTADATGNLNIQSGGSTVVAVTATGVAVTGTLSSSGATTLANGAVLGTPASGNLSNCTALNATQLTTGTVPTARLPAGSVIKMTNFVNSTRTALGVAPSTAQVILWSNSYVKALTSSSLYMNGNIATKAGSSGGAAYWWRINSGTWYRCGANIYVDVQGGCDPLVGYIDTSVLAAGTYTIDIAWSANNGGKPFTIWNPNVTDGTPWTLGTASNLNIMEVAV